MNQVQYTPVPKNSNPLVDWAHSHGFLSVSNLDTEPEAAAKTCKGLTHLVREHFSEIRVNEADEKKQTEKYYTNPEYSEAEAYVGALDLPDGFTVSVEKYGLASAVIEAHCTREGCECSNRISIGVAP